MIRTLAQRIAIKGELSKGGRQVSTVTSSLFYSLCEKSLLAILLIGSGVHANAASELAKSNSGFISAEPITISPFIWALSKDETAALQNTNSVVLRPGYSATTQTAADRQGVSATDSDQRSINGHKNKRCDGFVSSAEQFVVPKMAKPSYLSRYQDPVFGGTVIRITDSAFSEVRKPAYSTMQTWNADESLLLLYKRSMTGSGTRHILLDGHSYEPFRELDILPSDLEEVFWSHTNPDEFFYISKASADYGKFKRFSVAKNVATDIADFSEYCGSGLSVSGSDVHMQSLDDDLFSFRCQHQDGSNIMFSYRISENQSASAPVGDGTPWLAHTAPMPAPSGHRFWFQGAVLALNLSTVQQRPDLAKSTEHSSLGRTYNGQDALYQVAFDPSPLGCDGDEFKGVGHLIEHNLETGQCRSIISQAQGFPYTTSSTHASAQAYLRPELIAMSSIGNSSQLSFFTSNTPAPALFSEIYLADTNPDNTTVCRLAHHRSFGKSAVQGGYPAYFGEPHATISPSGTRIVFGSDWYDSGSVDSYVVELPGYQRP